MRSYEDLSRRALIKLNHDYDRDNDNALQEYLELMDETAQYESIRTMEKLMAKGDHLYSTVVGNGGAIKAAATGAVEGIMDKALNAVGKLIGAAF